MRIVYCLDQIDASGGLERITVAKANALSKFNENHVYIVVAFHRKDRYQLDKNVQLINLDVPYYDDFYKGKIGRLFFLFRMRKRHKLLLEDALNQIFPDIVIAVGKSEKLFLPRLKLRSRPVLIREIHFTKYYRSLDAVRGIDRLFAKIHEFFDYGLSIWKYDRIIVLTKYDKENYWSNIPRVIVMPNPLVQVAGDLSDLTKKVVIAVGRLVYAKNFRSLISSWADVSMRHPDWILEIYGEGPLREELQKQILELRLQDTVFLKGYSSDIMQAMHNSSVLVSSSLYEGFALVLIEAMSIGLPVVSYDCPTGPRDIIEDGENGFIVPLNDEETLSEKICWLIENEPERKIMGKHAHETSKRYSLDSIINHWMNLFEELLNNRRSVYRGE